MDLNALPHPEDEEDNTERHVEEYSAPVETSVQLARREREERRIRLRNASSDDRRAPVPRQPVQGQSRLPPGWLDCPPAGKEICGIIPSKVPLGEMYYADVPPGKRYSSEQVIRRQRKLGLVIDLTNTTRYYSSNEFKNYSIKYVKIQCRGRDAVPENVAVNQFVYKVMEFQSLENLQKKHILVHCTHGHNRTGYMIVHFLMRTQMMSVTEAIAKFAEARPPGIYKPDYIDALYAFYHEKKPRNISYPLVPEWKRSSEFDLNDDYDDGVSAPPPLNKNQEMNTNMTNDDILGDDIPVEQLNILRQECYQMLNLSMSGNPKYLKFPGSHPVSLSSENLVLLKQSYYYATWKADGTRYMMLIKRDGCYLIDRCFNFRRVQMRFPCMSGGNVHHFTLLDGEMVIDTDPNTQKQTRRYLVYDLMAINNLSVVEWLFSERWKMIERDVIVPRTSREINQSMNPYYDYGNEPFSVITKQFWFLSDVKKLLKVFIPKTLTHKSDGLIFQRWDDPYFPRTDEYLLKWKYPEMNSVDFLFEAGPGVQQSLYLFDRGKKRILDGSSVVFSDDDGDTCSFSGKIIECSYNSEKEVWEFMRVRPDKSTPNEFSTFCKVMKSIKDNITEDVVLDKILEIVKLPSYVYRTNSDIEAHRHKRQKLTDQ
ncbi:mRNA-capping enzyme [Linum perenne]